MISKVFLHAPPNQLPPLGATFPTEDTRTHSPLPLSLSRAHFPFLYPQCQRLVLLIFHLEYSNGFLTGLLGFMSTSFPTKSHRRDPSTSLFAWITFSEFITCAPPPAGLDKVPAEQPWAWSPSLAAATPPFPTGHHGLGTSCYLCLGCPPTLACLVSAYALFTTPHSKTHTHSLKPSPSLLLLQTK